MAQDKGDENTIPAEDSLDDVEEEEEEEVGAEAVLRSPTQKRGRGRPRKNPNAPRVPSTKPARGRGRPRKYPKVEGENSPVSPSRGRGRPPKPTGSPKVAKAAGRGRGRPPKSASTSNTSSKDRRKPSKSPVFDATNAEAEVEIDEEDDAYLRDVSPVSSEGWTPDTKAAPSGSASRGRGRPPKSPTKSPRSPGGGRGRGRPRKYPAGERPKPGGAKKGRGRPPKQPGPAGEGGSASPTGEKRGRGRPKKVLD